MRYCELTTEETGWSGAMDGWQILASELQRPVRLRTYLQKAPDKVNMVPAGVLKPAQRSQFLAAVAEQTAQLGLLEAELAAIAADLAAAG